MENKNKIENWKEELAEYGALHNEDCCVNFPEDNRACDVGTDDVECCENMKMIASFFVERASRIVDFISYDMKCENEEQRKEIAEMYKKHSFDLKP